MSSDDRAALAAEVSRLEAELDRARLDNDRMLLRATRLAAVIAALGRADDRETGAGGLVADVADLFACDLGLLLLGDGDHLRVAERYGVPEHQQTVGGEALPAEVSARLGDDRLVAADAVGALPVPAALAGLGARHIAWVRLHSGQRAIGMLVLGRCGDHPFLEDDARELRAVGQRFGLSVGNARLRRRSQQQVTLLERLLQVGTDLAACRSVEDLARAVVAALRDEAPQATIGVYADDGGWRLLWAEGLATLPSDGPPPDGPGGARQHVVRDGEERLGVIAAVGLPDDPSVARVTDHVARVAGLAWSSLRLHERTAFHARHDPLTGLANRATLVERLDRALRDRRGEVAVVYADLDDFKSINDTLGHDAGDELLVEVAGRLRAAVRSADTIARLGGDEFVVVCEGLGGLADAVAIAERIGEAVARPLWLAGRQLALTSSRGVTTAGPAATPTSLLREADAAMYQAKRTGRGRVRCYDDEVRRAVLARGEAAQRLRDALAHDRVGAAYQPVVTLPDLRLVAVEALLRYRERDGAVVPAGDFLEVAAQSTLLIELGERVIDDAIGRFAAWQQRLRRRAPRRLLLNLAARQLHHGAVDAIGAALARHGLSGARLGVEITDGGDLEVHTEAVAELARLRSWGVAVGVDDFGVGDTSLPALRALPLDYVKIDPTFVRDLVSSAPGPSLVQALLRLGEALGAVPIAEGVETPGQRDELQRLGCRYAQGHLFGRAVLAETMEARLTTPGPSGLAGSAPDPCVLDAPAPDPTASGAHASDPFARTGPSGDPYGA